LKNLTATEGKDQGQTQGPVKAKQKPPTKENEKTKRSLPLNATNGDVKNVTKSKGEYYKSVNSENIFTISSPLPISDQYPLFYSFFP
jgi:hypothetical protein